MATISTNIKKRMVSVGIAGIAAVCAVSGAVTYATWVQTQQVEQVVTAGENSVKYSFNGEDWYDFTEGAIQMPAASTALSTFGTLSSANFISNDSRTYNVYFKNVGSAPIQMKYPSVVGSGDIFSGDEPLTIDFDDEMYFARVLAPTEEMSMGWTLKAPDEWDSSYQASQGVVNIEASFDAVTTNQG